MVRRSAGRSSAPLHLPEKTIAAMRSELTEVADRAVTAIIAEVPSYAGALSGSMGERIRHAVQVALGGFLTVAERDSEVATPLAPALEGAYQLGRGEARSGRSMEALLAAYRIGARVSWRDMSRTAVDDGVPAEQLSAFAELVFAYIDELSAASAAGHSDELESSGRIRVRNLERLARALLTRAPADAVVAAAERAEWEPPETLTAVLLPESQVRHVLSLVDPRTLHPTEELPQGADPLAVLLVGGVSSAAARQSLLRTLTGTSAVVGPSLPWLEVATSLDRAVRCRTFVVTDTAPNGLVDTEAHLAEIVLGADPEARAALRTAILDPLAELRPSTAEKLAETLRAWLLHHGRRDAIAAELFVHPQTVRYRVGQLREVYGSRLSDPRFVLEATLALA